MNLLKPLGRIARERLPDSIVMPRVREFDIGGFDLPAIRQGDAMEIDEDAMEMIELTTFPANSRRIAIIPLTARHLCFGGARVSARKMLNQALLDRWSHEHGARMLPGAYNAVRLIDTDAVPEIRLRYQDQPCESKVGIATRPVLDRLFVLRNIGGYRWLTAVSVDTSWMSGEQFFFEAYRR